MTSWSEVVDGTNALKRLDKDEVKSDLPLEWVFQREGLVLEPDSNGSRLIGSCPFKVHSADAMPFAVYGDNFDHWGCWKCAEDGDVFDAIAKLHRLDFKAALQSAGRLLAEKRLDIAWLPRVQIATAKQKADPNNLTQRALLACQSAQQDASAIEYLINEKQREDLGWLKITSRYLIETWGVGTEGEHTVVVPHFSIRDASNKEVLKKDYQEGESPLVRALKTRTARSHLYAVTGSDLGDMYGGSLDRDRDTIVICEGESDTWCTHVTVQDFMDVVGVPSGAGTPARAQWLPRFKKRNVILAFDGDATGRKASERWFKALQDVAKSVKVCALSDGRDMARTTSIGDLIADAIIVRPIVGAIAASRDGQNYIRKGKPTEDGEPEIETPINNWILEAERELTSSENDQHKAYEGIVNGKEVVLQSSNCSSNQAIVNWSSAHGCNWRGIARDAQDVLGMLQSRGPFLARGHSTGVAGWHAGNFVWPEGHIGADYWRYIPPLTAVPMPQLHIKPGNWDPRCIKAMQMLHLNDVTTPIMAWLAIAPLRSMMKTFPFLAVVGSSGSGKTTLIEVMLNTFGWNINTTLTATTPHGVHSLAGATNGLPIWFDEYRPGAREDALAAMNQVLRDAYNGTPSMKGGGTGESKMALTLYPTDAPIIVTGEDAFSETSHIERAVLLNLPIRGKNAEVLQWLTASNAGGTGFGHAYLTWLIDSYARGTLPSIAIKTTEGRVAANIETLEIGWRLLNQFYNETTGEDLGKPDFSRIERGIAEANSTDPVTDALVWANYTSFYGESYVWIDGVDDVLVKVADFVREVQKSGQFILPGSRTAIGKILDEQWAAVDETHPVHGRIKRLPGMRSRLSGQA